jgi:hypothetical protein
MSPARKMFAAKKVAGRALVWMQGERASEIRDSGSGSLLLACGGESTRSSDHHNNTRFDTAIHLFRCRSYRQNARDCLATVVPFL